MAFLFSVRTASAVLALSGVAMGTTIGESGRSAGSAGASIPGGGAVAGKVVPQPPAKPDRVRARWHKPRLEVPAEMRAAELPTYYLYEGKPVEMRVDVTRIAVKFTGTGAELTAALTKLGIGVGSIMEPGAGNWKLVTLGAALNDAGAVHAVLELVLTDPAVEFASPVFDHATIEGGYYLVTPEINVRVVEEEVKRTDAILGAMAGLRVREGGLGDLPGARQVLTGQRNGFAVLRAANALNEDPRIAWAEPDALSTMELHFVPNDQFWGLGSMWGWEQANDIDTDAETAWDLTRGTAAMRVLVMDCGTEQNHPDINQLAGRDFTTGAVGGVAGGGPSNNGCDNHGTSVSGIISGAINNSIGGVGVAPNCRTLSAKTATEQSNPCSSQYAAFSGSWLANALAWGLGQGCLISNSSFGVGSSATITNAYDDAEAAGMIHFASAGNGGADNIGDPTLGYPASLDSVQAVAAIDSDGGRSSFSNWGTGLQFSCPGTNVRAPDRQGTLGYNGNTTANGGDYTQFGGTSAASPFCAGICALIWGAFPDFQPASILSAMRTSCRDLGTAGYDTGFGWGFPNVDFALRFLGGPGDWCEEAVTITGTAYNPSNVNTTGLNAVPDELQESCEVNGVGTSRTRWYRFVPPCSGTIDVDTIGSNYDTVLSVWRGTCASAVQVACNDDAVGTQSRVLDVSVSAGFTYLIKVAGYGASNAGGSLDFNFTYTPAAPANDMCSDAATVLFSPSTFTRCTLGATNQLCESNESCELNGTGTSKSVWFQYTPSVNGRIDVDTEGSDYDTVLSVWNGCPLAVLLNGNLICIPASEVACDDDSGAGTTSRIIGANVRKGVTYRIKVAGYGASSPGGDMVLHFAFRQCPADHNQSGAVTVQDIFDFLADYFAGNISADYNNSGTITVQDIFDYLALYFAGVCV